MDDLIRKQTILNMLDTEQFENQLYTQSERDLLARIWFAVNAIPCVDAVEVVRCKDCIHYKGMADCEYFLQCGGTMWFCAWGERKTDVQS